MILFLLVRRFDILTFRVFMWLGSLVILGFGTMFRVAIRRKLWCFVVFWDFCLCCISEFCLIVVLLPGCCDT